jgi:hypothetical protein
MALFSSLYLLLRCSRPSLRSAGIESNRYQWAVTVQTATRAAAQCGVVLIRKMHPFEEPHAFPLGQHYIVIAGKLGSVFKAMPPVVRIKVP